MRGDGWRRARVAAVHPLAFALLFALAACAAPAAAPSGPAPLPTLTPAPTARADGLYVDAGADLGPISPLVFGSNYGPWLFVPLQMRPQAVAARLTFLRMGDNWIDQNDTEDWQADQFIALARELGSEPSLGVRLKGGSAKRAADLVRYLNVVQKYGVRYWSIGNEPNLYGGDYDVDRFNREWREWAMAMRAVDPTIKLIGPETNQFVAHPNNPDDQKPYDWLVAFLKANGDLVDVVSVHRYPFPKGKSAPPPSMDELRQTSPEWDASVPALRALIRQNTGRDLPVAVTEINSSWAPNSGGEATLDSHFNAIWWADTLGRLIRQGVDIVAQFAILGEFGLMDKYEVYPIYHVYSLYQKFGERRVLASSDDPQVSVFAAKRADGALTVMIVNLAAQPVDKPLTMANAGAATVAETWRFDREHPAEQVADTPLAAAGAPTPLSLPPESLTLLVIAQP